MVAIGFSNSTFDPQKDYLNTTLEPGTNNQKQAKFPRALLYSSNNIIGRKLFLVEPAPTPGSREANDPVLPKSIKECIVGLAEVPVAITTGTTATTGTTEALGTSGTTEALGTSGTTEALPPVSTTASSPSNNTPTYHGTILPLLLNYFQTTLFKQD